MLGARSLKFAPTVGRAAFQPGLAATRSRLILRSVVPKRGIQTEFQPASKAREILDAQRVKRPSSPHFTIYQPQLTWVGSIANRFTGTGISVLLYGFTISYVLAPLAGAPFTSTELIQLVGAVPESLKIAAKTLLASSFAFHSLNGLRHLSWDAGKLLTLKGAYRSGYFVLGATAVSTVALLFV